MPMAERGGPVLSILLGILLVVVTWHLHGEVRRLRDFTLHILERLVACQAELARHCPADPDREGR